MNVKYIRHPCPWCTVAKSISKEVPFEDLDVSADEIQLGNV